MSALQNIVEESLCRVCSGRVVTATGDGERLQECPHDESRQAECLSRLLYRLACLDETLRQYAAGERTEKPELSQVLHCWSDQAVGPNADPNSLCFHDVLRRR